MLDNLNLFNQLPGCWGCKDINSKYIKVNKEYARLFDSDLPDDYIGLTDFDLPGERSHFAEEFQAQDKEVIRTGKQMRVLNIHLDKNKKGWRAHLFTKSPWRDVDNKIVGVIFSGMELKDTAILEVGHWICRATEMNTNTSDKSIFTTTVPQSNIKLNARESEVLFFLLYGKKPQYIASSLDLSVKTIDNYVGQLREKFNVGTKNQLIEMALDLGYSSHIPNSLIKRPISIILKD